MRRINKKGIRLLIVAAIYIVVSVVLGIRMINSDIKAIDVSSIDSVVGGISEGTEIKQTFHSSTAGLKGFDILFATYMRENNCKVFVEMEDNETNEIVYSTTVDGSQLKDNTYYSFRFFPLIDSENKDYTIIIRSDADDMNTVTIWMSDDDMLPSGNLMINGELQNGDISFNTIHGYNKSQEKNYIISLLLIVVSLLVLLLYIIFAKKEGSKAAWVGIAAAAISAALSASGLYIMVTISLWGRTDLLNSLIDEMFEAVLCVCISGFSSVYAMFGIDFIKKYLNIKTEETGGKSKKLKKTFVFLGVLTYFLGINVLSLRGYNENPNASYDYSGSYHTEANAILINCEPGDYNFLDISFAQTFSEQKSVWVYSYSDPDSQEAYESSLQFIYPGDSALKCQINGSSCKKIIVELEAAESYGINSLSMEQYSRSYSFNLYSFVGFLITAILLGILIRKKAGGISLIKNSVQAVKDKIKESASCSPMNALVVILNLVLWLAVLICIPISIWFYSKTTKYLMFIVGITTFVVYFVRRVFVDKNFDISKLFFSAAFIYGCIVAYCIPISTGTSWDDLIHYEYSLNNYITLTGDRQITLADTAMYERRYGNVLKAEETFVFNDIAVQDNITSEYTSHIIEGGTKPKTFYNYLAYIPTLLAFALRKILHLPFYVFVLLCRTLTLLLYCFIGFKAIRRLESGKLILSAILLLPTSLFVAVNFSYDYWVTAWITYGIAYFIGLLQKGKEIQKKDMLLMLGAVYIGCGPKAVYFSVFLVFLFISNQLFRNKNKRIKYSIVVLCCALLTALSFAAPFLNNMDTKTDDRGEGSNGAGQVQYIIENPGEYTNTLITFVGEYFSTNQDKNYLDSYYNSATAILLRPVSYSYSLIVLGLFIAALTDKNKKDSFKGKMLFKVGAFLTVFATICIISTALFVGYTKVGATEILGVQWRYQIPILFLFMYALGYSKISNKTDRRLAIFVSYACSVIPLYSSLLFGYLM